LRSLQILLVVVASAYFIMAWLPPGPAPTADVVATAKVAGWSLTQLPPVALGAVLVFFVGAMALGMGNGAVFQLVPLRFRQEIGVITGLVGAAGGAGGFALAKTLGWSKGLTGSFTLGFVIFAALALVGIIGLTLVKARWRTTWGAVSGARV
jgi:NNP family nitrate/nitrite transporter-like MFS transporter